MTKKKVPVKTLRYLPTIDEKPARWCDGSGEEGQLCFAVNAWPAICLKDKKEATAQVRKTVTHRKGWGYEEDWGRFSVATVIVE